MSSPTQFGYTLFLSGFQADSKAERLKQLDFSKNASKPAPFDEKWLQHLIMRHPSLLPVDKIEPAFNSLVPICVELPVGSGSMDNLFATPAGDLALVECKLWRNPEARREVVAQIINYATEISTWTYEMLQNAIWRTKPVGTSKDRSRPSLYELVSTHGEIDEVLFHDAVSRNLKRGRFLLLIVGDGIHEGVESMTGFLQQHAGFHFTLGFVAIALFEAPGGYIAQPRLLARTTNIERGIVTLDEGHITIKPSSAEPGVAASGGRRTTITQERYFEQLEKEFPGITQRLNAFLDNLATYDVSAEFGTESMILRWRPENGRDWNLGTISKHGLVWLDLMGVRSNSEGLPELHKQFLEKLKNIVPGAYIRKTPKETAWYVAQDGKRYVTAAALLADDARRDGWIRAIAEFQSAVKERSNDN